MTHNTFAAAEGEKSDHYDASSRNEFRPHRLKGRINVDGQFFPHLHGIGNFDITHPASPSNWVLELMRFSPMPRELAETKRIRWFQIHRLPYVTCSLHSIRLQSTD
ncbi:hypothetical protein TNCV_2250661 [Trichonephila clavipes]|nr:hypothetical protein TNCV_2250661 [Trichonephila clavipes]